MTSKCQLLNDLLDSFSVAKFKIGAYTNMILLILCIVWFQIINIPPPWRELEIQKGREGGKSKAP